MSTILVICLRIVTCWSVSLLHTITDYCTYLCPAWCIPNHFLIQSHWYLPNLSIRFAFHLRCQKSEKWGYCEIVYIHLPLLPGTELLKSLSFSKCSTRSVFCSDIWSLTPPLTRVSWNAYKFLSIKSTRITLFLTRRLWVHSCLGSGHRKGQAMLETWSFEAQPSNTAPEWRERLEVELIIDHA